jgi:hypothetical protein
VLIPRPARPHSYIDKQDELSVSDWMIEKGLPPRINDEARVCLRAALSF